MKPARTYTERPTRTRSLQCVFRTAPPRFVIAFHDGILVRMVDGNRLRDMPFKSRTGRPLGHHELTPEHQNFVDCMMMARVAINAA